MGNNPSILTPETLLALKKFRVFEEFPRDREEAANIIANEATNALKYVNCNFSSRLGGHKKRKVTQLFGDHESPQRKSRRTNECKIRHVTPVVDSAVSNSRVSTRGSTLNNSPLPCPNTVISVNNPATRTFVSPDSISHITNSSISYRVLLPHDLFRLSNETEILLVVDKQSHGFERNISNYLSSDELKNHIRTQDGDNKYEFRVKLFAFSLRDQLLNNSVDEKEQILRYNQGDGMTLRSVQHPLMKYLVRFKDIVNGDIQLYEQVSPSFQHPDFFAAAGRSKDPCVYGPIYKAFLKMVHGDSEQTLRVLVGYYRQKCESLVSECRKLRDSQNVPVSRSCVDINEQIKIELSDKKIHSFCYAIESVYETYLHKHFCSWNDLASPLIPSPVIIQLMVSFETMFPVCSLVLSTSCSTVRQMALYRTDNSLLLRKRFLNLQHFLSMCRLKNTRQLTTWALIESLSQIARGISRVGSGDSVMRRYSLTYTTVHRKLHELAPYVRENTRRLLKTEIALDIGFDNFQIFKNKKYQRDGSSSNSMHATCRLAKRAIPIIPSVGSILQYYNNDYAVVSIIQSSVYASLLRVECMSTSQTCIVPWPTRGWSLVFLCGTEKQHRLIDYRNCYVPRSMYMRKYLHSNLNNMMFMSLDHPLSPTLLPSNIGSCSTAEYMTVLRRSRIGASFQRVFCSILLKTKKVNLPDHLKVEQITINEYDQTNIDSITKIMANNKPLLLKSGLFHKSYTRSWNPTVKETSQMVYLELSKHDEISNDGSIQVLVELLHDYGLIDKDTTKDGNYVLSPGIESKRLRIYGDGMSMERIRNMENKVYSVITHPGKAEFVDTILTALKRCQQSVGDLHIAMHMMVVIYNIYYPGLLQVVQSVLRWKRIQLNPLHRYQPSRDLCLITLRVLEGMRMKQWGLLLQRHSYDKSRSRRIKHPCDYSMEASRMAEYSLEELAECCSNEEQIIFLIQDYESFCNDLEFSGDEITMTICNFMKAANDFSLYQDGIKEGDSISMEVLLNEWLPVWKSCRKTNYVNLTMVNMEILYSEMSSYDLEALRKNRMMRHTAEGGMLAMDECCEILNDQLKKMSNSDNLQSLVNKSLFVSLMRRCTKCTCPDSVGMTSGGANKKSGIHVTPTRKSELATITKLFESVKPFNPMNRKITDNWLWDSYNFVKVKVTPTKENNLTAHEARVAEVFNNLSTSDCHLPCEETDDNGSRLSNVDQEPDSSTYNSTTDECTLDDKVDDAAEVLVNSDSTEADATAALKSLSNLKKYKINTMCTQNLTEVGWELLGDNVSEERRWAHETKQRERCQIDEAVKYHIQNQKKMRSNRIVMMTDVKPKMNWEIDMKCMLQDKQYQLYV